MTPPEIMEGLSAKYQRLRRSWIEVYLFHNKKDFIHEVLTGASWKKQICNRTARISRILTEKSLKIRAQPCNPSNPCT